MSFRSFFARFLLLVAAVAVASLCGPDGRSVTRADAPPEPPERRNNRNNAVLNAPPGEDRADIQATIQLCLAALEQPKPDYVKFIRDFADPAAVAKIEKEGDIQDIAREFGKEKAAALVKILKSITGKSPSETKDDTATFDVNPDDLKGITSKSSISFRKVDGRYYLMN